MKISVLIPYRGGTDHWRSIFARTQSAWRVAIADQLDLDIEVVVGKQTWGGPMHVARCINDAAARATGDVFVLWGADHWPDIDCMRWLTNIMSSDSTCMWQPLFEHTGIIKRDQTYRLLNGTMFRSSRVRYQTCVPTCVGIFAIRREAFYAVGGEDERFVGWGMEDAALRHVLSAFYGKSKHRRRGAVLNALWHPIQPRADAPALANIEIYHNEYLAHGVDKTELRATIDRARKARERADAR